MVNTLLNYKTMIPKETLIKTIKEFDIKRKELDKKIDSLDKKDWTFEKFQEWKQMQDAWNKLEDVIEFEILPYTK